MDYVESGFFNASGTNIFQKVGQTFMKDGKLTTTGKATAGALVAGAAVLGASKLLKKKSPDSKQPEPNPLPPVQQVQPPAAPAKKSNTMLYVGIGAGVLLLVGVVIFVSKK